MGERKYRKCTREDREYIVKTLKGFGAGCLDCGKRVTPDNLHSWDEEWGMWCTCKGPLAAKILDEGPAQ